MFIELSNVMCMRDYSMYVISMNVNVYKDQYGKCDRTYLHKNCEA